MPTPTPKQGFSKSLGGEAADIAVIDANWDLADEMVTLTGGQTLTNKTLTSPHLATPVVDSGGLTITAGDANTKRIKETGTLPISSDFLLAAGWGSTASLAVTAGSNDQRGTAIVACAGSGQTLNPTVTFTFKDGTWTTAPFAIVTAINSTDGTAVPVNWTTSATQIIITAYVTPTAGKNYTFVWMVLG